MAELELHPKYYHENFEYLLGFVKERYSNILEQKEWRFLRKYYTLPENAQCLFIRFCNRKGLFFRTDDIVYDEIESIPENLKILEEREFIQRLDAENQQPWVNDILDVLTKSELSRIFNIKELKNSKKQEIIDYLIHELGHDEIIDKIAGKVSMVKLNFEFEVNFLMFLFFGNRSMDMTEFVLRDLGRVHYFKTEDDNLVARFNSRKEAEDKWLISDQFLIFEVLKEKASVNEIFDWYKNFNDLHTDLSDLVLPSYKKLQVAVGKFLERQKQYDLAIDVYQDAQVPPARERMVRCLAKNKDLDEARFLCEFILENPLNIDETYFAEYFLSTISGKKSRKKTTEFLKQADTIILSSTFIHQVESGSIEYFYNQGFNAGFSENFSWRALFGLTFWDIIFDPGLMSFHHPFQRRPSDFYLPDFFNKSEQRISEQLDNFTDNDEWLSFLWAQFTKFKDIANPFVLWEPGIWDLVRVLVSRIPVESLKKVLLIMAENLVENSRGFPDLLIWTDDSFELIEIKSPNDTLSNQQLFWLETFQDLDIPARVLKVDFRA